MTTVTTCESCGMPLGSAADHAGSDETSPYCAYCVTPSGELQPFEERFERVIQWGVRKEGLERAAAEVRAREYMRSMPAWRDHPALQA
jgi:hypothetical protein